jgi:hypothetical protein
MDSQFYERTALSRDKAAMLTKGTKPQPAATMATRTSDVVYSLRSAGPLNQSSATISRRALSRIHHSVNSLVVKLLIAASLRKLEARA